VELPLVRAASTAGRARLRRLVPAPSCCHACPAHASCFRQRI